VPHAMNNLFKGKVVQYVDMFLLMLASGSGYVLFVLGDEIFMLLFVAFLVCQYALLNYRRQKLFVLPLSAIVFVLIFLLLYFLQYAYYEVGYLHTLIGLMVRLLLALLIVLIVRYDFIPVYVNVILFVSLISLMGYLILSVFPFFGDFASKIGFVAGVGGFYYRNVGIFMEPGLFGIYIVIAMVLNIFFLKKTFFHITNLILLLALITTFSLAAYFNLLFLSIIYIYYRYGLSITSIGYSLIVLSVFFIAYQFDWIGAKIAYRMDLFLQTVYIYDGNIYLSHNYHGLQAGRLASFVTDLRLFMDSPFIGFGLNTENRFSDNAYHNYTGSTNGFTDFFVRWGIVGGFIYFHSVKKFFVLNSLFFRQYKQVSFYLLMMLVFVSFSQNIYYYPFFWSIALFAKGLMAPSRIYN